MVRRITTSTCHGRDGLNVRSHWINNVLKQLFGIPWHQSLAFTGFVGVHPSVLALNTGLGRHSWDSIFLKSLTLRLSGPTFHLLHVTL